MEIKSLSGEIRNRFRSEIKINGLLQCVTELVLNSLDAKATAVAVRVNILKFRIQVVDNGIGISKSNMDVLGTRYMTNKCYSLADFESKHKYFGYRGESLASIKDLTESMTIMSRSCESDETCSKTLTSTGDQVVVVRSRPTNGTTVTLDNFLFNQPIRQKRVKGNIDLNEIKSYLESLSIIYPNVSFSLRNDVTGDIILNCHKAKTVSNSLINLHTDVHPDSLKEIKVAKDSTYISGLIYIKFYNTNKLQFIYINRRPIYSTKLQKFINKLLEGELFKIYGSKEANKLAFYKQGNAHLVYVINICIPYSEVELISNSSKTLVEFKSWETVLKCIEKVLLKTLDVTVEKNKLNIKSSEQDTLADQICTMQYKKKMTNLTSIRKVERSNMNVHDSTNDSINETAILRQMNLNCDNVKKNKTLGLRNKRTKAKLQVKLDRRNIFDEPVASQYLTLNLSEKNLVCDKLNNVNKSCSEKSYKVNHNQGEGKDFLMNAFLKSVITQSQENNHFVKPLVHLKKHDTETFNNLVTDRREESSNLITEPHEQIKNQYVERSINLSIECYELSKNITDLQKQDENEKISEKKNLSTKTHDQRSKNLNIETHENTTNGNKQNNMLKTYGEHSKNHINVTDVQSSEFINVPEEGMNTGTECNAIMIVPAPQLDHNEETINNQNILHDVSFLNNSRKKRQLQKLNSAGQLIIDTKLDSQELTSFKLKNKSIQTSFVVDKCNRNEITSKCIQTTFVENESNAPNKQLTATVKDSDGKGIGRTIPKYHRKDVQEEIKDILSKNINKLHNRDQVNKENFLLNHNIKEPASLQISKEIISKNKIQLLSKAISTNTEYNPLKHKNQILPKDSIKYVGNKEVDDNNMTFRVQATCNRAFYMKDLQKEHNMYNPNSNMYNTKTDLYYTKLNSSKETKFNRRQNVYKEKTNMPHTRIYRCHSKNYSPGINTFNQETNLYNIRQNILNSNTNTYNPQINTYSPINKMYNSRTHIYDLRSSMCNQERSSRYDPRTYSQNNKLNNFNINLRNYDVRELCNIPDYHNRKTNISPNRNLPCRTYKPSFMHAPEPKRCNKMAKNEELHECGIYQYKKDIPYVDIPLNYSSKLKFTENRIAMNFTNNTIAELDTNMLAKTLSTIHPKASSVCFVKKYKKHFPLLSLKKRHSDDEYRIFERQLKNKMKQKSQSVNNFFNKYKEQMNIFKSGNMQKQEAIQNITFSKYFRTNHIFSNTDTTLSVFNVSNHTMGFTLAHLDETNKHCESKSKDNVNLSVIHLNTGNVLEFSKQQLMNNNTVSDMDKSIRQSREHVIRNLDMDLMFYSPVKHKRIAEIQEQYPHQFKKTKKNEFQDLKIKEFYIKNEYIPKRKDETKILKLHPDEMFLGSLKRKKIEETRVYNTTIELTDDAENLYIDKPETYVNSFIDCKSIQYAECNSNKNDTIKYGTLNNEVSNNHVNTFEYIKFENKENFNNLSTTDNLENKLLNTTDNLENKLLNTIDNSETKLLNTTFPKCDTSQTEIRHSKPQNEWIEKKDHLDNVYYMNTRTGMSTYTYPHEEAKVTFTKRSEFMPKGLSPILKEVKQINVSLSPTSKNCLQNEILKCFDKDLDIIKWQKFISNKGAQNFFDLIYRKEQKQYETLVPNISNKDLPSYSKKFCNSNGSHKFSHDIFSTLVVIGQLDSKFIVTVSNLNLIILFDQHAVHERIRLENLLQDYMYPNHGNNMVQYKSTKCDQSIKMKFTETDTYILRNFKHLFENMGLSFEIFEDYILIKEIPTCFYNKYPKNVNDKNENLLGLIRVLIMDEISMLQTTRGIVSNIPTAIQHVINTEACRGAIKFGEKLTVKECVKYIMELSKCDLPFQCAHGRPTLVPIMEVESANESIKNWLLPPNLKIFKA